MLRLTPVLAPTGDLDGLTPREKVRRQSEVAREAVRQSSRESGLDIEHLEKDDRDVPLPDRDVYWSLSHTSRMVAGIVAPCPVGIDVEGPRQVRADLKERVLSPDEETLLGGTDDQSFLRAWTAKEALLKCLGIGIAGLSKARIVEIQSDSRLRMEFESASYAIHQERHAEHVAAVCLAHSEPDPSFQLDWIVS